MILVDLIETHCWCGLPFAIPSQLHRVFKEEGKEIYCPLGHSVVLKETTTDRLRCENDRLTQRLAQKDDDIEFHKRQAAAARGQTTKLKRRTMAGLCPCCRRNFQNLARHMKTKHPEFADQPDEKAA